MHELGRLRQEDYKIGAILDHTVKRCCKNSQNKGGEMRNDAQDHLCAPHFFSTQMKRRNWPSKQLWLRYSSCTIRSFCAGCAVSVVSGLWCICSTADALPKSILGIALVSTTMLHTPPSLLRCLLTTNLALCLNALDFYFLKTWHMLPTLSSNSLGWAAFSPSGSL